MKKAIIIYQSKKGTTKQLSNEIADIIKKYEVITKVTSVDNFNEPDLSSYDYIFLGCWTKGLMFFAQHPDAQWEKFVKSLSLPANADIAMFTTYKLATGSMFSKMNKCLPENQRENILEIKSKNNQLPEKMISSIENFIG